ncbi:hypothetical protein [Nocardia wallacei]|uniref:hypothetical protein n=1 Tax=Nocardia wallacei TaxID=480035 RepID=UPI0024544F40|nr:hypothetical protein [Nocardia wallacei]
MSSPSADLYYGYDLGEMYHSDYESTAPGWWQATEEEGGEADWEDELARRLGWVEEPFPDDYPREDPSIWRLNGGDLRAALDVQRQVQGEYERTSETYRLYSASRAQRAKLLASVPVELETYGYDEGDTVWALRHKESVQSVSDWGSIELKPLIVSPRWAEDIARFVELLELNVPDGPPAWHLNCSSG